MWEPGDTYHFIARSSDKCLDVPSSSLADAVQLQQFTCDATAAQALQLAAP